ncbi:MAG: Tar ligand binding domain-containing protein [Arsenophonus endosymbiont of Dermacentor nuttalli]
MTTGSHFSSRESQIRSGLRIQQYKVTNDETNTEGIYPPSLIAAFFCLMQFVTVATVVNTFYQQQSHFEHLDIKIDKLDTLTLSWNQLLKARSTLNRLMLRMQTLSNR